MYRGCPARKRGLQCTVVVETASSNTMLPRAQEEYKKIDLTLVCADGSKVEIPGAAQRCCMPDRECGIGGLSCCAGFPS